MALSASDFTTSPSSDTEQIVYATNASIDSTDNSDNNKKALVDYTVQGVYHTEPLFIVGNTDIQGFENYKQYDQYSGHAIKAEEPALYDSSSQTTQSGVTIKQYKIEEKGKRYMSGKTYYLGFEVIIVAKVKDNSNNNSNNNSN